MSRYEEFDDYEKLIKEKLSKKRFTHSINVAEECYHLAKHWGADEKRTLSRPCRTSGKTALAWSSGGILCPRKA